jgi:hypothetical protein
MYSNTIISSFYWSLLHVLKYNNQFFLLICSLPFSLCDVPLTSVFSVVCCACPCYLGLVIVSGLLLPLQWRYFLFSSHWQCFVSVSLSNYQTEKLKFIIRTRQPRVTVYNSVNKSLIVYVLWRFWTNWQSKFFGNSGFAILISHLMPSNFLLSNSAGHFRFQKLNLLTLLTKMCSFVYSFS